MNRTKISGIGSLVAIFVVLLLLLPSVGGAQDVTLTPEGKVPGKPFDDLQGQINDLETRVAALEASGGGGVERVVISGTIDLNADGDIVLDRINAAGSLRQDHFRVIPVAGLTTDDPPSMTLYRGPRTVDIGRLPVPFPSALRPYDTLQISRRDRSIDATALFFENGRILLRFKGVFFNSDGTPTGRINFGLDGEGGTGDFRLVLIR